MSFRPVDLPQYSIGIEGIGKLNSIEAVCRRAAISKAKLRWIGAAWLGAGRITVHCFQLENAYVSGSIDCPGRRGFDFSRQIDVANAIVGGLRRGVGRAPVLLEQFNRNRRGRA